MFCRHPSEPMVDERRLPDTGPCNDCNDIYLLVCPCPIQERNILLSTKNIATCNGQSGYGDLLWCESCPRFPEYHARRRCPHILEALTSDSTPFADSVCYHRHRLQKFGRIL